MPYSSTKDLPASVRKLSPKQQRQWMHVWNSSYDACMKRDEGGTASCESEAFRKANGVVKGAEMPDGVVRSFYDNLVRLEKGDSKANYRSGGTENWQCGDCRFFDAAYRSCSLVEGTIEATYVCDLWTERLPSQPDYMYTEQTVQIFMEAPQAFKADLSKPSWIPFLPTPGKFKHPQYGEIDVTAESNKAKVQSVKDRVYQEHIPLDAEHETKLSGAVGYITDMRMNDNGSADALIEWTDRGRTLAGGDNPQFKYVSPEWFDSWTDPATSEIHHDVIAGGAITTRPFFKDKVLRALVASEAGVQVIKEERIVADKDPKDDKKTYAEGTPEYDALIAQIKADATKDTFKEGTPEFQAKVDAALKAAEEKRIEDAKKAGEPEPTKEFKDLQDRITAAETANTDLKTANETLSKSLKEIKDAERRRRFSDLVAGVGGANDGGAWVGDKDKHVTFLEQLADKVGESDPMFVAHIEQQNAAAAQVATAGLFSQTGSSGAAPGGSDAQAKLDQLSRTAMEKDPKLSFSDAEAQVLGTSEGARLYAEIDARRPRAV